MTVPEPIWLPSTTRHHAAAARVRAAMLPWLGERFGNPSGAHRVAQAARQAVDERDGRRGHGLPAGRRDLHQRRTEADNLAVAGVHGARPGRVLCSAIEHEAVLGPVARVGG